MKRYILDNSIPEPNSGCWLWLGTIQGHGYGCIRAGANRNKAAHRASYETFKGSIPDGLEVDHLCRLRCCVNPDHLEVVTKSENVRRAKPYLKKKTHCPHGHEFTPENTHTRKSGATECRICMRERTARRRAAA